MGKKKQYKAKEPVRLRYRELANGNKSIYLDIYYKGERTTETVDMKLIPEVDEASRIHNLNVMQQATAIKSARILELMRSGGTLPKALHRSKMPLLEWMRIYKERKKGWFQQGISSTIKHLKDYGANVTMAQANKDYIKGFIAYLRNTGLSTTSQAHYVGVMSCAMSEAVRDEVITDNPFNHISNNERPKASGSVREYLTIDEVKTLINTPCKNEEIKRAYLFACFCGLRVSDIRGLKWGDLQKDGDSFKVSVLMAKTKRPIYLKLSQAAMRWIPERGEKTNDMHIFNLPVESTINRTLKIWTESAGITKRITMHTSRHTFATGARVTGADLYTISGLLGHTNIKTTQIYAKMVDEMKDEAVDKWSSVFE